MYTCRAQVTLESNSPQRATSELRGELERKVRATDPLDVPDWMTMTMTGPTESWGRRGEILFDYEATVRVRSRGERDTR